VGLLFFTDRVERFVPPKKGRKHVLRLIDEILAFQPRSKRSNLDSALNFLSSSVKRGAVVILASDFFSPFDKKKIEILAKKHDFICLRAVDPRDTELPNVGLLRVEDPETGESAVLPTGSASFRKEYAETQKKLRDAMSKVLKKSGASLVDLPTQEEPAKALYKFFRSRKGAKS
jgi:uncharacterized protein (DUF58 family)